MRSISRCCDYFSIGQAELLKVLLVAGMMVLCGCRATEEYSIVIRGGTVHDGSGATPFVADVGIRGARIAAIGDLKEARADTFLNASGLVVSPGFVNMLSWAPESLIMDGRSQSDIRQGITLEVFGEGQSMGPLNESMKAEVLRGLVEYLGGEDAYRAAVGARQDDTLALPWTTMREHLEFLVHKGVAPNVASLVGATTVREHELGHENRAPTPAELGRMEDLVDAAMLEGALGLGASLIYAPAFYAKTDELVALAKVVSRYDGLVTAHIRSEGNQLLESIEELLTIAREANVRAEIYHLKAAGRSNWEKLDTVIARVEDARGEGLSISADIYPYTAAATGLDAAMPPDVQEGGLGAWRMRLKDPVVRDRLVQEINTPTDDWENLFLAAGPENVLFSGFRTDRLRPLVGRTLADVAAERGAPPAIVAMDLVIEDSSRVDVVYFVMSEENIRKKVQLPWVSIGTDAASLAPEGAFLRTNPHPRAYGTFARLLGKYVREEGILPLEEAIRRITSMPADNLAIVDRGRLYAGYFADIAVFDPEDIRDHATFAEPHQYSTGMRHVLVNGTLVLLNGEHTGALPGQVVLGPGVLQ